MIGYGKECLVRPENGKNERSIAPVISKTKKSGKKTQSAKKQSSKNKKFGGKPISGAPARRKTRKI